MKRVSGCWMFTKNMIIKCADDVTEKKYNKLITKLKEILIKISN